MIELRGVSKTYGSLTALHPTDLHIPAGCTTALIGSSGCGKSTLLRLIIHLIPPTAGTLLFDGEPVSAANALDVRRRTGYVIQDGGLFPHLTARDNVLLLARHLGKADAPDARLRELCDLTRLPMEFLARYPAELSGGQRQRVSLMRALMLKPDVLLLDEPMAALDPLVRAGLQTDLKAIFAELKQTVVLVTHDMAEAGWLADQIVLMESGRIVQRGTLADLRERPAAPFVSEFLTAQRSLVTL
jgi:osmoprotectant transport system ATP-binding protein